MARGVYSSIIHHLVGGKILPLWERFQEFTKKKKREKERDNKSIVQSKVKGRFFILTKRGKRMEVEMGRKMKIKDEEQYKGEKNEGKKREGILGKIYWGK